MPVSTIQITFEGMLLLFVNDDREYCDVGFLKDVPHHTPKLLITKIPRGGGAPATVLQIPDPSMGSNFQDRLWLDVNKDGARVRLHKSDAPDPFLRNATDKTDFRWAVNLEGHEVYRGELKSVIAFDRLKPMLRINDGRFYAQTPLSANELSRQRFDEASGPFRLGKVAVQLRAEIGLEAGNVATFFNGDSDLGTELRAEQNVDYGIYVSNTRPPGHAGPEIDADHYHPVVASGIRPSRRVHFFRYQDARSTPDSVCLPGWMGSTVL